MKKVLYGTTALVAAGVLGAGSAEAQIKLSLGGYMNTFFSVASIDEYSGSPYDYNPTGLFSDGEIHFKGSYKHDNGITFGVQVELEAFGEVNNGGDEIDERYIYISGDFGRIVAGSENSAAYIMHYAAPYVGLPINSGWATVFVPNTGLGIGGLFRAPGGSTYLDWNNDDNILTYYTPRFYGFQLGVSYAPTLTGNGDGKDFPVEADTVTEYHNGFAVGINYVEDFNGFGVAISGGYRRASIDDTRASYGFDDYQAWSVGANFSYAGFTVGGSYAKEPDGKVSLGKTPLATTTTTTGQAWDVGVSYSTGPWGIGVTYFHGETEGSVTDPDDDEMQAISGGISYALGPGINLRAGIMWVDWENEAGLEQTGIAGAAGLNFSF